MTKQSKHSVTESVRSAVERTFQSTVGSAAVGRERAQELVDEVVRRSEEGARSASEIGAKIKDAVHDLRLATGEEVRNLSDQISALEKRLAGLETKLSSRPSVKTGKATKKSPEAGKRASKTPATKKTAKSRKTDTKK